MTVSLAVGDCLAVMRDIPADTVGAVIADPPYASGGVSTAERIRSTTLAKYVSSDSSRQAMPDFEGDQRDQRAYLAWCALWMGEARRVLMPGCALMVFTDWRQLPTVADAVQVAGLVWRGVAVWDKVNGRPNAGFAAGKTEFIVWATKGAGRPDHVFLPGVLRVPIKPDERAHHITPKPVALLEQLCRMAPQGSTIVDPFTGSGSALIAAHNTRRDALGVEITRGYAEVAARRVAAETAQYALFHDLASTGNGYCAK